VRISVRRPSPALVLACLALGLVLGGTSYAAAVALPRNSVGTSQLKSSAVTTKKLAPNAVTSAKVLNGSLVKADFRAGSLPAGPTGPAGPAGPAGPSGLSGLERVETTSPANSNAVKTQATVCPTGKRLLGGGVRLNTPLAQLAVQQSFPDDDNTYRANVREMSPTAANWSITVFAVCAVAS
jgi:hypothetical protein